MKRFFVAHMVVVGVVCAMAQGVHAANINIWSLAQAINDTADRIAGDVAQDNVGVFVEPCTVYIHQSDIPLTITQPGNYCLAENIIFSNPDTTVGAISIASNDVTLDLQGHTMYGLDVGPLICFDAFYTNYVIKNGFLYSAESSELVNSAYLSGDEPAIGYCKIVIEDLLVVALAGVFFSVYDAIVQWDITIRNCVFFSDQGAGALGDFLFDSTDTTANHAVAISNIFASGYRSGFTLINGVNSVVNVTDSAINGGVIVINNTRGSCSYTIKNIINVMFQASALMRTILVSASGGTGKRIHLFAENIIGHGEGTSSVSYMVAATGAAVKNLDLVCTNLTGLTYNNGWFIGMVITGTPICVDSVFCHGTTGFGPSNNPSAFIGANVAYRNTTNYSGVLQPIATSPSGATKYWTNLSA